MKTQYLLSVKPITIATYVAIGLFGLNIAVCTFVVSPTILHGCYILLMFSLFALLGPISTVWLGLIKFSENQIDMGVLFLHLITHTLTFGMSTSGIVLLMSEITARGVDSLPAAYIIISAAIAYTIHLPLKKYGESVGRLNKNFFPKAITA